MKPKTLNLPPILKSLKRLSLGLLPLLASASVANAATVFQLDMERSDGGFSITEAGWTSSAVANSAPTSTTSLPTPAGITITAGGGGYFQGRAGGTWGPVNVTDAPWDNMVGDTTAARNGDGTVTIAFTGLSLVDHTFTAWHNVSATDSQSFSSGLYAITPSLTVGSLVGAPTVGQATNTRNNAIGVVAADFKNSVISFTPDGAGNATVVLSSPQASGFLTLSGIELTSVPEPSGAALLGLAGIALTLRRRRN
jgi:hypothetical protein